MVEIHRATATNCGLYLYTVFAKLHGVISMIQKGQIQPIREPDFDKAEMDLLKKGVNSTYTERFEMMCTLMKMNALLRKAKITHKTIPTTKVNL